MVCQRCGAQNADTAKFCQRCGNALDSSKNSKKKNTKKIYYIIGAIIIVIALIIAIMMGMRSKKAKEYETYLASAEKYIEELNYEQARDFYLKAIEIAPKQLEAYVKLAQVYISEGDNEKAEQILELAKEQNAEGSEKVQQLYQELTSGIVEDSIKQEQVSNAEYISVVKEILEDMEGVTWSENGYGALYDVDDNGVDELIMIYTMNKDYGEGNMFPTCVCSVYTIDNGTAKVLIDEEILYAEAGGPWGYAAVVKQEDNIQLAIMSETGETGIYEEGISRWGSWKLYQVDGSSIELKTQVEYDYVEAYINDNAQIVYDKSKAIINDRTCSYYEYEEWKNDLENLLIIEPVQNDDSMTIEMLYDYLQTL